MLSLSEPGRTQLLLSVHKAIPSSGITAHAEQRAEKVQGDIKERVLCVCVCAHTRLFVCVGACLLPDACHSASKAAKRILLTKPSI